MPRLASVSRSIRCTIWRTASDSRCRPSGFPRTVGRGDQRDGIVVTRVELGQLRHPPGPSTAAVQRRHQRRGVAEQEAAARRGRPRLRVPAACGRCGTGPPRAARGRARRRIRAGIRAPRRCRSGAPALRPAWTCRTIRRPGSQSWRTPATGTVMPASPHARHQVRRPAMASSTNTPYSTAVSIRPLYTYRPTYRMSTTIQTMPVLELLARQEQLSQQAAGGQEAIGVRHVGVGEMVEERSRAARSRRPTRRAPSARAPGLRRVTTSGASPAPPCSHWYQPQIDTRDEDELQPHVAIQPRVEEHHRVGGRRRDREQPGPVHLADVEHDRDRRPAGTRSVRVASVGQNAGEDKGVRLTCVDGSDARPLTSSDT